jgi:aminopeptidase N
VPRRQPSTSSVLARVLFVACVLAGSFAPALPSAAADPAPAPLRAVHGEEGLGDEYFPGNGNGGYDVGHYALRLRYTPADDRLRGTATLWLLPTRNLESLTLDFALDPTKVVVDDRPAAFTRQDTELRITPARQLRAGRTAKVAVSYDAVPSQVLVDGRSAWHRTSDGAMAVGEPSISAWWFPGNDHPQDKATFDVSVAVPTDDANTKAISNGTLNEVHRAHGWTRWNWRSSRPTATYLMFLVVGRYDMEFTRTSRGLPQILAWSSDLGPVTQAAKDSLRHTGEILDFLSAELGPYPFEAEGGVVGPNDGVKFALENQTRPVYAPGFFAGGVNTSVMVHELAHQWFGDSVSLRQWRDIWLNEGLATYAEWLWSERQGLGTAQEHFERLYRKHPADDRFWMIPPGNPGTMNLFSTPVYHRGAMAVHALRTAIGDSVFRRVLRAWTRIHRYANGSIEEFVDLAERCSGQQLEGLFTVWLMATDKPRWPDTADPAETLKVPTSLSTGERTCAVQAGTRPIRTRPPGWNTAPRTRRVDRFRSGMVR